MNRSFTPRSVLKVLSFGLAACILAASTTGTETTVLGVLRGGDGSPALLLKVPGDAALSARDVSAMLDAAKNRAPVIGRQFGDLAVTSPQVRPSAPEKKRSVAVAARAPAKRENKPKPAEAAPVKPAKPDVIIFEPDDLKKSPAPAKAGTDKP